MDMLFAEEFACSSEFLNIFLNEINISSANVVSVYLSKTDAALGESDLTVVIESSGQKIGLLIEDKIDAIAMPNQAERYSLRGKKEFKTVIMISFSFLLLHQKGICLKIRKH